MSRTTWVLCLLFVGACLQTPVSRAQESGSIIVWGGQVLLDPFALQDLTAVDCGSGHSLGLKADGSVVAWGFNGYGQCNVPAPNADFLAISAGGYFSLGLKADGSIVAWGDNREGQCTVPAPNTGFIAVAGGNSHVLALRADGSIVAWGSNADSDGHVTGQCDIPTPNTGFIAVSGGVPIAWA